jgi:sulfite exporter TauE/SafE
VPDLIHSIFQLCGVAGHGTLPAGMGLLAMFALGATGSVLHCAPMCGPIVGGQVMHKLACLPCARAHGGARLRQGLLLPYHAGRITTYAALGALAGAAGFGLQNALQPARAVLLALAALALILAALPRANLRTPRPGAGVANWRLPPPAAAMLKRLAPGSLGYGLALGLLPCGLVYLALLAACAAGHPLWGAALMIAFGAGTMPVLAIAGITAQWLPRRLKGPILLANAAILAAAAAATFQR